MIMNEQNWLDYVPELQELSKQARSTLTDAARVITVQAGQSIFQEGEPCEYYLLMLEGSAKVQKLSETGQVITLYHLKSGQACELTTACLLAGKSYPAAAVAETEVHALLVPKVYIQEAMSQSRQFRNLIFSAVDERIQKLVSLVEEVTFGHTDSRLACRLLQEAAYENRIETTHHTLAEELGTAREVISRVLKEFERNKWVILYRGEIEIIDTESLRAMCGGQAMSNRGSGKIGDGHR